MSKAAISLIQTGLRDAGFSPGVIDGFYGPKTANAAQSWLLRGGIGPGTAVALIQSGLRDLGFAPGAIDGRFGAKTSSAAQAWLMARGVPARAVLVPTTSSMIHQGGARHPVDEICIHCSATLPDWWEGSSIQAQRAEIRRWHVSPPPIGEGWNDIGYHHLVFRKGATLAGRAETVVGAGVRNHNQGVIHICLIGGHGSSERDLFREHFTRDQDVTLRGLIQGISMRTQIRLITGHNQYAAKACPGFNVSQWLREGY